jgi:hypothetical protein
MDEEYNKKGYEKPPAGKRTPGIDTAEALFQKGAGGAG